VTLPTGEIKDAFEEIGQELLDSGVLNTEERAKVGKWTLAMGFAVAQGDTEAVKNYRVSLGAMLGIAEVRAAAASEKAAIKMANVALDILVKVALAAI
jgi:hypothetical protein